MSIRLNYSVDVWMVRAASGQRVFRPSDGHAMMKVVMSENARVNEPRESFIGSMKGTMEIVSDIVAPIDLKWDADAETPGAPDECSKDR
jgi:hypothetical protein